MLNFSQFFGPAFGSLLPELILESIEQKVQAEQSLLPNIEITPKIQNNINKSYLDFVVSLYFLLKKNGEQEHVWFLEEIAAYLLKNYPELGREKCISILENIIRMANSEQKENE